MASTQTDQPVSGSRHAAIFNLVVRTLSDYTGRGPTRARTYIAGDLVSVVLQDTLSKGERSLTQDGLQDLVLTMRKAYQGTMRHDLISGVEGILGRKVIAFFSDNNVEPDMALEAFLLAPDPVSPCADGASAPTTTPGEAITNP